MAFRETPPSGPLRLEARRPAGLETRLLLGWMSKEEAVQILCEASAPEAALSCLMAERTWEAYRARVDALPERKATPPARLKLKPAERQAANRFLSFHRERGNERVLDVIKIDPMELVVHQLQVATAKGHRDSKKVDSGSGWLKAALPMDVESPFGHVTVALVERRLLLWSGYHRSFARVEHVRTNQPATGTPKGTGLVLALSDESDAFSPSHPNHGMADTIRSLVCGPRPPLFADLFDDRLYMTVRLRVPRERYGLA